VRFIASVFVTGLILNLTGWAGNVLVLGSMWDHAVAVAPPPMSSPFSPLVHALLQFVSDFVFAFVLCVIFRLASPGWRGSPYSLAYLCAALTWLGGVPMTYLGMVNGGYLPARISIATTILALVTFCVVAPLLPKLLPTHRGSAQTRVVNHSLR
jgi:hypothetical protein